ncbi:hypothetical protein ABK040_012901 [Willaertia magna]
MTISEKTIRKQFLSLPNRTSFIFLISTILFITLFPTLILGNKHCLGACVPKEQILQSSSLPFCERYLPNSTYVCLLNNATDEDSRLLKNFDNNARFLPDDGACTKSWKRFACMRSFGSCDPVTNITYDVCYNDCIQYTESCWNRDLGYNPFNWFYQGVFWINPDLDLKFKYFCALNTAGLTNSDDYNSPQTSPCTTSSSNLNYQPFLFFTLFIVLLNYLFVNKI